MNSNVPPAPPSPAIDRSQFETWLQTKRWGLLSRYRWLTFVLPLAVYMLAAHFEPPPQPPATAARRPVVPASGRSDPLASSEQATRQAPESPAADSGANLRQSNYPWIYFLRLVATCMAVAFVWPGYREFPFRVRPAAIIVGVIGIVVWVGICRWDLETRLLKPIGLGTLLGLGQRVAFDPYAYFQGDTVSLVAFITTRMVGLALVVPVIEEFFLRGFVLRMVTQPRWWELSLGQISAAAIAVGIAYGPLAHPAEFFAALAWFTLIMGLMLATRSLWDCIIAHMVTNGLLGAYVLVWQDWALW